MEQMHRNSSIINPSCICSVCVCARARVRACRVRACERVRAGGHVCIMKWAYSYVFVSAPGSYEMEHHKQSGSSSSCSSINWLGKSLYRPPHLQSEWVSVLHRTTSRYWDCPEQADVSRYHLPSVRLRSGVSDGNGNAGILFTSWHSTD